MAKYDITQLEQATTVPAGSLHLVEMGDGSGTKAVTQEILINETGKALKVGDLTELQTEEKTSLVAAINEAAQSGGGGTSAEVDILDTKEEIEANTEPEKAAGALAVKDMLTELNDNLQFPDGVKFYPDVQNGVRGYNTDAARGADTFYPFKSGADIKHIASGISRKATTNDVASISKTHAADEDGTIMVFCSIMYTGSKSESITLNGSKKSPSFTESASRSSISLYKIPVKKGDNIKIALSATNTANYEIFVAYFMEMI